MTHRVCDNKKIGIVNLCKARRWLALDSQVGLSTVYQLECIHTQPKVREKNFVSLSKANKGKTIALIGWQVSCVMTSPAKIARLGVPNAYDRSSDGSNLLNVKKKQY